MSRNTPPHDTYQLLDSGDGRKLERVGPWLLVRPAAQAVWRPRLPEDAWDAADAVFIRKGEEEMTWKNQRSLPETWNIALGDAKFHIKTTGFGHLGVFPEQRANWEWITRQVRAAARRLGRAPEVLNLFGYTGGSSLAALAGGASVTHLDASRGVVDWARENAELSGLGNAPCRWMVDDAQKFVQREMRRERLYDGIILDPPSFGRGSKGQVWKIEDHLPPLLENCRTLLARWGGFILLSGHTPGFSPLVMQNLLAEVVPPEDAKNSGEGLGEFASGEMTIPEADGGRVLPSGTWARWSAWDAR
ncbi:MAG: class I SAM-dependent methyltransferase [Nitrospirota bacterium]|nr:class I SAM-dependent methyltransferase [Nitrospirota bacterium]